MIVFCCENEKKKKNEIWRQIDILSILFHFILFNKKKRVWLSYDDEWKESNRVKIIHSWALFTRLRVLRCIFISFFIFSRTPKDFFFNFQFSFIERKCVENLRTTKIIIRQAEESRRMWSMLRVGVMTRYRLVSFLFLFLLFFRFVSSWFPRFCNNARNRNEWERAEEAKGKQSSINCLNFQCVT